MARQQYKASYRACIGKDADGKYHYKRFAGKSTVSEDKALKNAKKQAERWKALNTSGDALTGKTLRQACEDYIAIKDAVLSPATIRGYWIIVRNRFAEIMDKPLDTLTQADIQRAVNNDAKRCSPKTVANAHGFLASVFAMYRPSIVLHTRLPEKQIKVPHVPSSDEISALLNAIQKSDIELYKAVLLAAFGSLRRSEICALMEDDINRDANTVTVSKAMVPDKNNTYIIKHTTKSQAGTRTITLPPEVIDKLQPNADSSIVSIAPHVVTQRFDHAAKRAGIDHCRFHALRHYQASILHAMGVPDKYIMERGGWKTNSTLQNIYQHTMDDKRKEVEADICSFFESRFRL